MPEPTIEEMCQGFGRVYAAALSEILDKEFGLFNQWLGREIKPLLPHMRVAGPAFTLRWVNDRSSSWTEEMREEMVSMLDSLQPLTVPVVDTGKSPDSGYWGEIVCNFCKTRGIEGAVIDGGVRDSAYVVDIGFNMFAAFTCGNSAQGRSRVESYQEPIAINGVAIRPGDFVVGDLDGVYVVPEEIVVDVYHKTVELADMETDIRREIRQGASAATYIFKDGRSPSGPQDSPS
jgi:4-hydroxy-4-methyl-2-oxoglutarate aldolase